jgi:polyhydroxybutyrate depolymerase
MRGLLLVPLASCFACAGGCSPRATWIDLDHDGLDRGYALYSPTGWEAGTELPVVFALHGAGGNATSFQRFTGFNALADRERFHVVYPEGLDAAWNDGRTEVPDRNLDIDDLGFLDAVYDDVVDRVAPGPRFLTGVSNGAFMTWAIVCSGSTRYAAIAPVIGGRSLQVASACAPAGPLPTLVVQGTADPLVPYDGGQVLGDRGALTSTPATLAFARQNNGCPEDAEPTVVTVDDDPDDETSAVTTRWDTGCDAPVQELRLVGGGHTWPGGGQYLPKGMVGTVSREVEGEEAVWAFFAEALPD